MAHSTIISIDFSTASGSRRKSTEALETPRRSAYSATGPSTQPIIKRSSPTHFLNSLNSINLLLHLIFPRGSQCFKSEADLASCKCPPLSTGRLFSGYSTIIPKAEASAHGSDITVTQSILKSFAHRIIAPHFEKGSRQKSLYLIPAYCCLLYTSDAADEED